MSDMRIVSLVPAATEIICLLGLRNALVGRSHECDFPAGLEDVPALTQPRLDFGNPAAQSAEIDAAISAAVREGLSLYDIDTAMLAACEPDLILTQTLCDVCAAPELQVHGAVRDISDRLPGRARVLSLEAGTLDGIFASIAQIGAATGRDMEASALLASLQARVDTVEAAVRDVPHKPGVAALEWLDPFFSPGHWVPELINRAGGRCVLGQAGALSARISWDEVIPAQPEMVLLMPCGFGVGETVQAFERIADADGWRDIPATYLNQIYALAANDYFSRPGPRVVDGLELIAGLLHPGRVSPPGLDRAQRVNHLLRIELR
jgi:iron complex transport system substrate-binding protein